jgi:hypothetical protein
MEPAEDAAADDAVEEEAQLAARRQENIRALLSNKYGAGRPCMSCMLLLDPESTTAQQQHCEVHSS